MAKIKTTRPEAAEYQGREAKFVRDVIDGPAYSRFVDQAIVEIDGAELYFFANEVILTDDEAKGAQKARDKQADAAREAAEAGQANIDGKKALLETYKRGADVDDRPVPKSSPADLNPQNRTPQTPPAAPVVVG